MKKASKIKKRKGQMKLELALLMVAVSLGALVSFAANIIHEHAKNKAYYALYVVMVFAAITYLTYLIWKLFRDLEK